MDPIKSARTFIRRQLKIRGATYHSGRGYYEMEFDCDAEELDKRFQELKKKLMKLKMIERPYSKSGWDLFKIKVEFFASDSTYDNWRGPGKYAPYSTVGFNKAGATLRVFH